MTGPINHPPHYGGASNPYEAIKVIEAWELGFNLGNVVKYISRHGKKRKSSRLEDLKKARWYLDREIETYENRGVGEAAEGVEPQQDERVSKTVHRVSSERSGSLDSD